MHITCFNSTFNQSKYDNVTETYLLTHHEEQELSSLIIVHQHTTSVV